MAFRIPHFGGGGKEREASAEDLERAARVVRDVKVDQDEQLVSFYASSGKMRTDDEWLEELDKVRGDMTLPQKQSLLGQIKEKLERQGANSNGVDNQPLS